MQFNEIFYKYWGALNLEPLFLQKFPVVLAKGRYENIETFSQIWFFTHFAFYAARAAKKRRGEETRETTRERLCLHSFFASHLQNFGFFTISLKIINF